MKILVSGLINIETTLKVNGFPINYYPIDYPFFGIKSEVAGVAYNLSRAFQALGDEIKLLSYIGDDEEGQRILRKLKEDNIDYQYILSELKETPTSIILYDRQGKRQIYCDLKDIQEKELLFLDMDKCIRESDIIVACNTNFNRTFIKKAKELGKTIATDVHVLNNTEDSYNNEFMQYADILFFSDEQLPCNPEIFLDKMKDTYSSKIFVIGMGEKGAMLYERSKNQKYYLQAVRAEKVVNTVGAGDALFSSFLHYYGKGYEPIHALERAQIFAAKKIEYNGASIGFCEEGQIEEIYRSITCSVSEIH